jgi:small subunit ribosomal protein S6
MKKNYELSCLIPVETLEEETKAFSGKIESIIRQEQGEDIKAKKPSFKKLGYPIKKNKEAIFLVFEFSIENGNLLQLEKNLKLETKIIRMIIVERAKIEESPVIENLIKKEEPKVEAKEEAIHQPKFEKVEIGEIDKKIEEMLKD